MGKFVMRGEQKASGKKEKSEENHNVYYVLNEAFASIHL